MIKNPFPGPQPYRASDRGRFYGRDDMAHKLQATILATRCVTVHGPSGAGKSSLVQAAVLPSLIDSQDVRVARVDGWPEREDPARWLALSLFSDLGLGELPEGALPGEAVIEAAKRAARGSSRLMIVYLDQIEQLFHAGRTAEETEPFFACLQGLVELPLRTVRVVLSLREDYLGTFRDRLRDRGRVLDNTFRVGPLTVGELTSAMCQAAAAGEPPQTWPEDQTRALMLQVRLPGQAAGDDAEAQSAYAQIVCRSLFQQRAQGEAKEDDDAQAEPILRRYLESTLSDLGPRRDAAQRLLEDHLVTADGSRTLRTEKELLRLVPRADLMPILQALEGAAILRAEEHQGSRYFEIGHDWLARKVFEQRQEREAREEQLRREEERRLELERQKKEADERLARARRQQRTAAAIAGIAVTVAAAFVLLYYRAEEQRKRAELSEQKEKAAHLEAVRKRVDARDQGILAGYLALAGRGEAAWAMKLLPEVKYPEQRIGWISYASDAIGENALRVTLRGHTAALTAAAFDEDGRRVLTASLDWTARVWNADGTGVPIALAGHKEAVTHAVWSPGGRRVLTISDDGTARVWSADGRGEPVVLEGMSGGVLCGAFSADGERVAIGGDDKVVHVFDADGGNAIHLGARGGHTAAINAVIFLPDGRRVASGSDDGTARVWSLEKPGEVPVKLGDHKGRVQTIAAWADDRDVTTIVTTSHETLARLFVLDGKTVQPARELKCTRDDRDPIGRGEVVHAALSPDGTLVATACSDGVARVFEVGTKDPPLRLEGATSGVTHVAFSPDGDHLATASLDGVARVYPARAEGRPLVLSGHHAPALSIAWSPDSRLLVTASADRTAKVWSAAGLEPIRHGVDSRDFFHTASLGADGTLVVAAHDDNTARLLRSNGEVVLRGHEGWVAHAAPSPDGKRVVTAAFDKTGRVWSADGTGEPVVLRGHTGDLRFAAFSADGRRVVTASEDRTARVWDADEGNTLATLSGHEDWVTSAAFSPDGASVATASYDQTARVWRADGKGEPVVLAGHRGAVYSVLFDAPGSRVVTASEDGTARVWSAGGKGEPVVLRARGERALLVAVFSMDGTRVAAASNDGLIYVWSADGKGRPVVLRTAPPDPGKPAPPAIALAFLENDRALFAVLADNTTHRWQLDVKTLVQKLASAHADCLPADARQAILSETAECAAHAFEQCESSHGRRPAPPRIEGCGEDPDIALLEGAPAAAEEAGSSAPGGAGDARALRRVRDLGPEGRHVKVVVLPGDAHVEIEGVPAPRRNGAIDLLGKKGEVRKLRVSKGDVSLEQDVTIQEDGASPALVDLNAKIVAKAAARAKKEELKPGQGDMSALLPGDDD